MNSILESVWHFRHLVPNSTSGRAYALRCLFLYLYGTGRLWNPHPAYAHPLDSFATDQYVDISMASGEISLIHRIEFAEIPTIAEFPKVDTDSDLSLSEQENARYLQTNKQFLMKDLVLLVKGTRAPLEYRKGEVVPQQIPALRLKVITSYRTPFPTVPEEGLPFELHLIHRASARGDRQVRLLCSGFLRLESVWSSESKQPPGMAPPAIAEATALVYGHQTKWVLLPSQAEHRPSFANVATTSRPAPIQPPDPFLSLNPRGFDGDASLVLAPSPSTISASPMPKKGRSIAAPIHEGENLSEAALPEFEGERKVKPTRESWADVQFRSLFTGRGEMGRTFLIIATLLSLLYGAAHAMEPGHGKTIVAAYLVGSKGTVAHALLLALIVTFTHTFSVYILGLIALTNLDRVRSTYLPLLECGSWALIILMGIVLFLRYYRAYVLGELADPNYHTHGFGGHHSHFPHPHDNDHYPGANNHEDHLDAHEEDDHDHFHLHVHNHPHEHEGDKPTWNQAGSVSFWNLLALGITGGIVPCPGALFVMMLALTSGQAGVGLYLITVFSVGLAATLMAVGVLMVRSRGFLDRYRPNSRIVQLLPVLSSLVILVVGSGFLISGLLKHGIIEVHLR